MSHLTLSIRPATGGVRKFAVTTKEAVAKANWFSGDLECQSDQTWDADIYERIEGRGYVCRLEGSGQWTNRGQQGVWIGTGATAEAALLSAWDAVHTDDDGCLADSDFGPPNRLLAAARDYDAVVKPPEIE